MQTVAAPAAEPAPVPFSTDDALDQIIAELEAAIRAPAPPPAAPPPLTTPVATAPAPAAPEEDETPLTSDTALAALARLNEILAVLDPPAPPDADDPPPAAPEATLQTDADGMDTPAEPPTAAATVQAAAGPIAAKSAAMRPVAAARAALPAASAPPRSRGSLTLSPALHPDGAPITATLPAPPRQAAWARPDRRAERLRQVVIAAAALLPACAIGLAAFWGTPERAAPATTLAQVPLQIQAPLTSPPAETAALELRPAVPELPAEPVAAAPPTAPDGSLRAAQDLATQTPPPESAIATMANLLPDDVKALEISATAGNPMAQHDLAARYAAGRGVAQNYAEAIRWFSAAARQGVANAAYNLGVIYQQGLGVSPDAGQAIAWYREAAEAGHAEAQYNLGVALIEGNGAPANPADAVRWLTAAESSGVAQAAFNLGVIAELGLAGKPDSVTAARWYDRAAAGGDMQAAAAIARLRNNKPGEPAEDFNAPAPGIILASSIVPLPPRKPGSVAPDAAPEAVSPPVAHGPDHVDDTPGGFIPPDNRDLRPPTRASAEDIMTAQEMLARLGYNPGPADGRLDSRTMEAIVAFQRDENLPVDGEVSDRLLERLATRDARGR